MSTPVPFAPETLETIQRAFRVASDRRHDIVGLEHLLLAALEEPEAREVLGACGVDMDALRTQLDAVLVEAFPEMPASTKVQPEPSLGFDRVIQQAVVHAAVSSADEVDSASLLVFLLQEDDSHAAHFLREQGVDRLTLLRVVSHGAAVGEPGPASGASGDESVADFRPHGVGGAAESRAGRGAERRKGGG